MTNKEKIIIVIFLTLVAIMFIPVEIFLVKLWINALHDAINWNGRL